MKEPSIEEEADYYGQSIQDSNHTEGKYVWHLTHFAENGLEVSKEEALREQSTVIMVIYFELKFP